MADQGSGNYGRYTSRETQKVVDASAAAAEKLKSALAATRGDSKHGISDANRVSSVAMASVADRQRYLC